MAKRILVIDDSPMTVELISQALTSAGFAVASAKDLSELDDRLAERPFDLVLVDVNMPEMYGDDVVEFLRVQRQVKSKLVLYSDIAEAELERKAAASGADGYIVKAAGLEAAVESIRALVDSGEAHSCRVLVVEPESTLSQRLERGLTGQGYELLTAHDVGEATRLLLKKATRPDAVVVDTAAFQLDSAELCRTIKGNSVFSGIRVVLVAPVGTRLPEAGGPGGADVAMALDDDLVHRVSTFLGSRR
jgi:DNA-binding response OmpR family regulator